MAEKLETGYVELTTRGAAKVKKDLDGIGRKFKQTSGFASDAAKQIAGVFTAAAVIGGLKAWVAEIEEGQLAVAKLNAVLKSTGNTTGFTSKELQDLASSLQGVTRFGDEATLSAITFLATLDKIGGQTMKDAVRLSQDLATVMGSDLDGAARMVGKALQDPINGLTALQRLGVRFTEDQKNQIKALVESGKQAEAQAIVLGELEKRFGGAAKAARETLGGALDALKNNFGDLMQEIAAGNDGPLKRLLDIYAEEADAIREIIALENERKRMKGGKASEKTDEQLAAEGDVGSLQQRKRMRAQEAAQWNASWQVQAGIAVPMMGDGKKYDALIAQASRNSGPQRAARAAERAAAAEDAAQTKRDQQGVKDAEEQRIGIELARDSFAREQERQEKLDKEIRTADDVAAREAGIRAMHDKMKQDLDQPFLDKLAARENFQSQKMGLEAFADAIQQSAMSKQDLIPKEQLKELKDANKGLKAIDKNLKKMNQFGAGAVA